MISDAYMQYEHLGTRLYSSKTTPYLNFDNQYTDNPYVGEVVCPTGRELLIGTFSSEAAEHENAIVCITTDDPGTKPAQMEFSVEFPGATEAVMYYNGEKTTLIPDENGFITFTLDKGYGAFITLGH